MKVVSWNVRGLRDIMRRVVIKDILRRNKVRIALIQESKIAEMNDKNVREVWGIRSVQWVALDAVGSTRGILLICDTRYVKMIDSWRGDFSVSAVIEDLENNQRWLITTVYGPNLSQRRIHLWR